MLKERLVFMILIAFFGLVIFSFLVDSINNSITGGSITGEVVTGKATSDNFGIAITVSTGPSIVIRTPENTTYNFGNTQNVTIDLNVTNASFAPLNWTYKLENLKYNLTINQSVVFTPNTIIFPSKFSNRLTVFGDNGTTILNSSVVFYVNVSNSVPVFGNFTNSTFGCEGSSFVFPINASDVDEDSLSFILPGGLFGIEKISEVISPSLTFTTGEVFSGILQDEDIGSYTRTLRVTDEKTTTSKVMNFTVLETNEQVSLQNVQNQTISFTGSTPFILRFNASDSEDGNQDSGNLSFNISFISGNSIFSINSTGAISTTISASQSGNYTARVCVTDKGILNPNPNLTLYCGQDGLNSSSCQEFNLFITGNEIQVASSPAAASKSLGGPKSCLPRWSCDDWFTCDKTEDSLLSGLLSGDTYRFIQDGCFKDSLNEITCGYQTRICKDVFYCNVTLRKPIEIQSCLYTFNPSCEDNIKNCHDNSCEF
ncbi:MAG: hypothetical protein AABY05_03460, partial [Nanoarchaeota archaeon]